MSNRVLVVTGTTSGIGKALALEIAKTGQTLVMIARAAERGQAALQEIRRQAPNPNIDLQLCDLSILSSVRNVAEILKSKYEKINVLINNTEKRSKRQPMPTTTLPSNGCGRSVSDSPTWLPRKG